MQVRQVPNINEAVIDGYFTPFEKRKSQKAYAVLSVEDRDDYNIVKSAILKT